MTDLQSDFERDFKEYLIKTFKENFDAHIEEYLNNEEELEEVIEAIYESEMNYNNCDSTTLMTIWDRYTIEEILKDIKKEVEEK